MLKVSLGIVLVLPKPLVLRFVEVRGSVVSMMDGRADGMKRS
jgi:hydrogenase/urease accessory protein HupE